MSSEKKEVDRKLIAFPSELTKEIEEYQKQNFLATFTATVIELVRRGLKYKE